jgi:hypothetical protein
MSSIETKAGSLTALGLSAFVLCAGFSDAENEGWRARSGDGVREAPRHEIAVYGARTTWRGLWGFGHRIRIGVFEQSDRIDRF